MTDRLIGPQPSEAPEPYIFPQLAHGPNEYRLPEAPADTKTAVIPIGHTALGNAELRSNVCAKIKQSQEPTNSCGEMDSRAGSS